MRFVDAKSKLFYNLIRSPSYFKIAGLDIGTKHIGVAISDETRVFVGPAKNILRKFKRQSRDEFQYFSDSLSSLVREHHIKAFVVGLPVYNCKLTPLCKDIIDLMLNVQIDQSIPLSEDVVFTCWDETDSTVTARKLTRQFSTRRSVMVKEKDGLAAAVILNSFLEHTNPTSSLPSTN